MQDVTGTEKRLNSYSKLFTTNNITIECSFHFSEDFFPIPFNGILGDNFLKVNNAIINSESFKVKTI